MNFVLIGAAGFVAPRHMKAIKETGGELIAVLDPAQNVGILDSYFPGARFFTEFERFDRFCEKTIAGGTKIDYVSICSPNYLHDAHCRFALRIGANAICEKPLVIKSDNLEQLSEYADKHGGKIFPILQLRCSPGVLKLKQNLDLSKKYTVNIEYNTPRGNWYLNTWKNDESKSGGLVFNLGIHLFDLAAFLFGDIKKVNSCYLSERNAEGEIDLQHAIVKWKLSIDKDKDPKRLFTIENIESEKIDLSSGFTELHTEVYRNILNGNGISLNEALKGIKICEHLKRFSKLDTIKQSFPLAKHTLGKVGKNTVFIDPDKCNLSSDLKIGDNCKVHPFVTLGNIEIGNRCKIQSGAYIPDHVRIGNNVFIGPNVVFTNDKYPPSNGEWKKYPPTIVEDDVSIGANATILPGITLGKGCLIGAGSVVTHTVPSGIKVYGNPAGIKN